jgi:hypothetical protein
VTAKQPDATYVALVEARRVLSVEDAAAFDAGLSLILANHIGDLEVLKETIALARAVGVALKPCGPRSPDAPCAPVSQW